MSIWTYKAISSGKGGFATPALLETFLNQLGAEGWEIIHFHTQPDNSLAFSGLARRSTERDWTLEDAAAAAARAEVEKLRVEFEAKFKGGASPAEEPPPTPADKAAGPDDGLRKLRDTDSDLDPDAPEERHEADEWDKLTSGDDLPTFFEAIQPLLRRNQRGAGMSVGVDHLAKKWGLSEQEVLGALKECGFTIPEDEDARPDYIEYDGDLFWVNVNRRGELWLNTKEKPRPVFRVVPGKRFADESQSPESKESGPPSEGGAAVTGDAMDGAPTPVAARPAAPKAPVELPTGAALLERIRPLMRRNRRGSGGSGSLSFLSRGMKCGEADLSAAFAGMGLTLSDEAGAKPVEVEIDGDLWWLNRDQRGGVWINGEPASERRAASSGGPASVPAEIRVHRF